MKQLTEEQAIRFAESGLWEGWTDEQIVRFQLYQRKVCVDFGRFMTALTKVLGRSVYTHELAGSNLDNIKREILGDKQPPTLEDIMELIPKEKRIVL